jgi:hypothetical protein
MQEDQVSFARKNISGASNAPGTYGIEEEERYGAREHVQEELAVANTEELRDRSAY